MVELCLMASHGYPPGLGFVLHSEQGFNRASKDFHYILPYHGSNQDLVNSHSFNLNLQQKEEWKSTGGLLDCNQFISIDSTSNRPAFVDVQDSYRDSAIFSFGIAERCSRQEKILKLLASGSIEVDLPMLYDLMGPQALIGDWPQQSLIYPTREFDFTLPSFDLMGDRSGFEYNSTGTEMHDILSVISELYFSKNTIKSSKKAMLVPFFERRRRARTNTNALKPATDEVKSHEKLKEKTSNKKKISTKTFKGREIYSKSYLHACESLLSVIVDRKQQGKGAIQSLKKSGPQLPQLLTQFSASIAGTGIAVVLSIICRVACSRVPLCASKLLSTGLGLGLVWLSWAVNKLRDTVISISRTPGKYGEKDEEMMNNLDRNLKDIYFRVGALMAVAVLRLA
ncbi:hypothetical protein ACJIZ3_016710 [Penstemon smallii]|uniref:Uncharacterized protein n=1 Tax=Penstemon smallii TaxID=265156 RepID=A0ABD3SUK2_9LAMI